MTINTFCQSPITTNTQGKIANVPNERQIYANVLSETIIGFRILTLDSTMNSSEYYHSEENDAENDPNRYPKVATHSSDRKKIKVTDTDTTNENSPHKLLINWIIQEIILVEILLIEQTISEDGAEIGEILHVYCTIISKKIVIDATRRYAHVIITPAGVICYVTDRNTLWDRNTTIELTRLS